MSKLYCLPVASQYYVESESGTLEKDCPTHRKCQVTVERTGYSGRVAANEFAS